MKTNSLLLILVFVLAYVSSISQTFVNTGQLVQSGNYLVLSGGTKWQNNGTANLQSSSEVRFSGNATQEIDGTNSTAFSNLRVIIVVLMV
jgi:hypothetical protein